MKYPVLACDYDGTLVSGRLISNEVQKALSRLKKAGRKLILVTGRELDSLLDDFSRVDIFDRIVVENGGVLYTPGAGTVKLLASPPSEEFAAALKDLKIDPLSIGRVIVSTRIPHDIVVQNVIQEQGLDLEIIYNKDSVMILPAGIDKFTGLLAALDEFGLNPESVIGVGDAENDISFLSGCGYSVAVANAIAQVKMRVDLILSEPNGAGIIELAETLMDDDPV
jgi:hypothetical protein